MEIRSLDDPTKPDPRVQRFSPFGFRRICDEAGIPYSSRGHKGLRFHDLRHSAATIMLALGLPDRVVMEMLGHSNLAMTSHYQHVPSTMLAGGAKRMHAALG